jgi:hypothetical protein
MEERFAKKSGKDTVRIDIVICRLISSYHLRFNPTKKSMDFIPEVHGILRLTLSNYAGLDVLQLTRPEAA